METVTLDKARWHNARVWFVGTNYPVVHDMDTSLSGISSRPVYDFNVIDSYARIRIRKVRTRDLSNSSSGMYLSVIAALYANRK